MKRRNTSQRQTVRQVFEESDRPLSTNEVLERATRYKPGIGIATIYRTLKLLLDSGWLVTVKLPNEPPRYEKGGKPHHHHFHCQGCGRVYEVPGCPEFLTRIVPPGFEMEDHHLLLYGRCPECVGRQSVAATG